MKEAQSLVQYETACIGQCYTGMDHVESLPGEEREELAVESAANAYAVLNLRNVDCDILCPSICCPCSMLIPCRFRVAANFLHLPV